MDANDKEEFWKRYYKMMYGADLPPDATLGAEEIRKLCNVYSVNSSLRWASVKPASGMRVVYAHTARTKPFLTAADLVMLRELKIGIGVKLQ